MLAQQRYDRILELLNKNGIVHNAELVKEMKVSSETVRKDMDALEKQGKLKRVHGGALPVSGKQICRIHQWRMESTTYL